MADSITAIIGGLFLIFLIYLATRSVARDKFNTGNRYDDFGSARRAEFKERAVEQFSKLGGTIAVLLIIGGGIGLAFSWETRSKGGPMTESERTQASVNCMSGDRAACARLCREGYSDACSRQ